MLPKMSLAGLVLVLLASGHVHETVGCVFARRAMQQQAEGHALRGLKQAPKPGPKPGPAKPGPTPGPTPVPKPGPGGPNPGITAPLASVPGVNATMWAQIEDRMWRFLQGNDATDTCKSTCPCVGASQPGNPPPFVGAAANQCTRTAVTGNVCGTQSRAWFRIMFHDAGTFDKNAITGGLDGSIQFELNRDDNEPFRGFVFGFYTRLFADFGGKASMSDIIVLAAYEALFKCGGPKMTFLPGRKDATGPNGQNLLPATTDSVQAILDKFDRMGFDAGQTVALIGAGHTIAALRGQKLDSTPDKYDVNFFSELLASTAPSSLPSDQQLLTSDTTKAFITSFSTDKPAWDTTVIKTLNQLSYLGQSAAVSG